MTNKAHISFSSETERIQFDIIWFIHRFV